jgi:putative DNA methylase
MSPPRYGLTRLRDLFTNRQLVAVCALSDLVREARQRVVADGGTEAYGDAIAMYLAFAVDKYAEYGCSLVPWYTKEDRPKGVFARQALPMVWDFAEVNPLCDIGGSWIASVGIVAGAIEGVLPHADGVARQRDAASIGSEGRQMVCTDPPYYDNVPYADLSDFFYVWLRRTLKDGSKEARTCGRRPEVWLT